MVGSCEVVSLKPIMVEMSTEDRNKENVYKLLVEIFEASILEPDLTDLIKNLIELYASFNSQGFETSFEDVLMLSLSERKRNSDVHKIFRFIADFAVTLDNQYKSEQAKSKTGSQSDNDESHEDDNEIIHPLLKYIFQILEKWSKATSYIVRFRSCQLLYTMLSNIQDKGVGEIDSETYEMIETLIQQRRLDVSSTVRAHAVLLAKFFQDPSSNNDPVIAGLCWQLQNDPNAKVRQNIVEIIAACEETIIPITNRFLYDRNANVRNAALLHICSRISVRSYTKYQQVIILKQCFSDSSAMVRRNADERLIPVWFRTYGDKLCVFLSHLRLGHYSLDRLPFMKDLLALLFKTTKLAQLLDEIDLDLELFPKMPLTGERVFLWHYFYIMAQKEEKLSKYIPKQENLIQFILKCFYDFSITEDKVSVLNELIVFSMDIINELEGENRDKLINLPSHVLKNPFIPHDVIPYAVKFFSDYVAKDGQNIDDILLITNHLYKMSELAPEEEKKKIALKYLAIISAVLSQEGVVLVKENFVFYKNHLIKPHLDTDDVHVKKEAFKALSLYSLLDLEEAKIFWPHLMTALQINSSSLRHTLLKCAFDILASHGGQLFSTSPDESEFIEALENLLPLSEVGSDERLIVMEGILKLFLLHHIWSPVLLARLMLPVLTNEEYHSEKYCIENFFQCYGESRLEADCLIKAFLTIINCLFNSSKSDPLHKINIKTVALQLLDFSKSFDESPDCSLEEKFKDLLILKLTRKFLKSPGRLSAMDLQDICSRIIPRDLPKLLKLEGNVKLIVKSLKSPLLLQTNPYLKKSMAFFMDYLKKIQIAINAASVLDEEKTERSIIMKNGSTEKMSSPIKLFNESKVGTVPQLEKTFSHFQNCSFSDSKFETPTNITENVISFSKKCSYIELKKEEDEECSSSSEYEIKSLE